MSSFTALNLSAEDIAFDAEEHTRELQIEESFKVFQKALKLQKDGKYDDANSLYDVLFGIDVITNDSHSGSPTIRTLRYLAHRNRGLLHFDELRSRISDLSPDDALEQLFNSLDDLIEALQHTEGDIIVINLLLSIFEFFGNDRLSRFLIEYELTKDENDDMYLHHRSKILSPNFSFYLQLEQKLLAKLGTNRPNSTPGTVSNTTELENLDFLKQIKTSMDSRHLKVEKNYQRNITVEHLSWKTVATKLSQLMSRSRLKSHKFKDGYQLQDSPLFVVKFTLPSDQHVVTDQAEQLAGGSTSPIGVDMEEKEPDFDAEATVNELAETVEENNDKQDDPETPVEPIEKNEDEAATENSLKRTQSQTQRASKRFRQQAESEPDTNKIDEFQKFTDSFSFYLKKVGLEFTDITCASGTEHNNNETHLRDFYQCLNNWTSRHSDFLSFNSSKGQNGLALNELINANITNSCVTSDSTIKDFSDDLVTEFLVKINSSNYHFCEVRSIFLKSLMCPLGDSYPLIDFLFDRELYSTFESLVITSETDLFDEFQDKFDTQTTAASVATLEVIINHWIQLKQKSKVKGLSSKLLSDLSSKIDHLYNVIFRWKKLVTGKISYVGDTLLYLRFRWCCLLFLQHEQKVPVDYLKKLLSGLYAEFQSSFENVTVHFPNYESIPTLNVKMIKNQSDKLNVLTTFEKTLNEDNKDISGAYILLETVLLAENSNSFTDEQRSMEEFISGSSINLKLKLWKILLDSYITTFDIRKYHQGLSAVLPLLLEQIINDTYKDQSELQRHQILLNTIGFYGDYINGFALMLEKNNWDMETKDSSGLLLQNIVEFLRILLCYNLHDYYSSSKTFHQLAQKSSSRIRDVIINSFLAIFCFYRAFCKSSTEPESKYDFFSIIHEQIGNHGFCDAAFGRFLRLSEALWKDADPETFESDVLQHLNCRFHISISNERFTPYDHHTQEVPLGKSSAIAFAPCLMNLILRKRNPLFNILKPDLKSALDVFFNAIGEPNTNSSIIHKNEAAVGQFLELDLDSHVFRNAFSGSIDLGLRKTLLDEQILADQGLFYSEAVTNLNMYKVRKKSMQSKASDLEEILKMIKTDLLYGTERAEPWLLLGQTFSLQVEDDLIWTSDKLNIFEKKLATASTQRRSILCFLMSLSVLIRNEIRGIENNNSVFALCLSSLSRELYHSLTKPMSGLCFEAQLQKRVLKDDGVSVLPPVPWKYKTRSLFIVTLHALKMAIDIDDRDWLNHFYLAQVLHKLKRDPNSVITASLKACDLNKSAIEPHYQLCSFLYKYVKNDKLNEEDALNYMNSAKSFFGVITPLSCEPQFESVIVQALKKIAMIDKKKWHHKNRYKLSTIYFDLQNFEKAYEEIESLVILKSTNKNLINIWKPELEPPGKHFVYTYNYILYYIKLTNCLADFHKLLLFTKKLRRYGAGMMNLNDAWDYACTTVCHLAKELVRSEKGFTDIEVPKLIYVEFVQASQILTEKYKSEPLKDDEIDLMTLLFEISEIRRMNNGFGSTSQLDDTFNTIYLKIYLKNVTDDTKRVFVTQQNISLIKPNGANIKTKVARRDILACATALVKAIEPKIKDHKVTDDIGFNVPEDIKQKHINDAKKHSAGSPGTKIPQPDYSESELHKSYSNLEATPTPKKDFLAKTPDNKEDVESVRSTVESEDEFHTPTNTMFDGEDP